MTTDSQGAFGGLFLPPFALGDAKFPGPPVEVGLERDDIAVVVVLPPPGDAVGEFPPGNLSKWYTGWCSLACNETVSLLICFVNAIIRGGGGGRCFLDDIVSLFCFLFSRSQLIVQKILSDQQFFKKFYFCLFVFHMINASTISAAEAGT